MDEHDKSNISSAMQKAIETHPFALGIFYQQERKSFEEYLWHGKTTAQPLHVKKHDAKEIQKQFDKYTNY
jgi:hypothetical protein